LQALVLFVSVLLAIIVMQDGTSNWLKGATLVFTYFFIAAAFWVHKDPLLTEGEMAGA
jgi:Ca2+/H+ antiporter